LTAIEDVEEFIRLVKTHEGIVNFGEEPASPAMIEEAERILGVRFPPSYRRFLELLGGCDIEGEELYGVWRRRDDPTQLAGTVHFTLSDRQDAELPAPMLVLQYDGMGGTYVLDTSQLDESGEAPVLVFEPPWVTNGRPLEYIAPNFGRFALTKTRRATGR
jgi:hypothetical protein